MDCCNHQCEACHKHKERTPEEMKALINRLNRIEGQVRGIRGMVENSAYCPDILTQVAATSAALNAFTKELLASHIRTCVADDIRAGHDEAIDELVQTLQKLMKLGAQVQKILEFKQKLTAFTRSEEEKGA